jgi:hypothetical protein
MKHKRTMLHCYIEIVHIISHLFSSLKFHKILEKTFEGRKIRLIILSQKFFLVIWNTKWWNMKYYFQSLTEALAIFFWKSSNTYKWQICYHLIISFYICFQIHSYTFYLQVRDQNFKKYEAKKFINAQVKNKVILNTQVKY